MHIHNQAGSGACAGDVPAPHVTSRMIIAISAYGNLKIPLDKSVITIGRKLTNDIHIRSRFISRVHARIYCSADGTVIIEDLSSRNGLKVNSHAVIRHQLQSGDRIDLGKTQLRYIDLSQPHTGDGNA